MKKISLKLGFEKKMYLILPFVTLALLLVVIPLVMIIFRSFIPNNGYTVVDNWIAVDTTVGKIIWKSLYVSVISTLLCILIGFPYSYCLARCKNKTFRNVCTFMITAPIWLSVLIKLIGLKLAIQLFFTGGNELLNTGWVIMGTTYMFLPFMILPLMTNLRDLPNNLLEASSDLGRTKSRTFFLVTVPWAKAALISGIMLVFLPAMTSVAISDFLDQSSKGKLIGSLIYKYGERGFVGPLDLSNASSISLVTSVVMFGCYFAIWGSPRIWRKIADAKTNKSVKKFSSKVVR